MVYARKVERLLNQFILKFFSPNYPDVGLYQFRVYKGLVIFLGPASKFLGSLVAWKWKWKWSRVQLFVTPWTEAHGAPLSLGFSRQEYWSGLPCPPPADLPDSGIEHASLMSPALQEDFFPLTPPKKPAYTVVRLVSEFWSVALRRLWHRSPLVYVTRNQLWIISSLSLPVLESLEALCWDGATSRTWKNPWSIAGKWAALKSISTCRGCVRRDNKFYV